MKKIKIVTVVGTRPEIIRLSSIINRLNNSNFIVTVRWSKGTDINSGCGQLAVLES